MLPLSARILPQIVSTRGGVQRAASSWVAVFQPDTLYAADERMRQLCISRTLEVRKRLGFKRHGAYVMQITYVR